jgi:hypothetical protein
MADELQLLDRRIVQIKGLLAGADIPPDAITISALIFVLADVVEIHGTPLGEVIQALRVLDRSEDAVMARQDHG